MNPFDVFKSWQQLFDKATQTTSRERRQSFDVFKPWQQLVTKTTETICGKSAKYIGAIEPFEAMTSWLDLSARLSHSTWERFVQDAWEYSRDYSQRWILFMDTMRQRGNNMLDHFENGMPPLLDYEYEVVLDASTFVRPVNYSLLFIKHPEGKQPLPGKRPLLVIDPRAGHAAGIGGFKHDSEIGMGLLEGHPVYTVSFTPEPCPGQTLEDVEEAEIHFLEEIRKRHPDRDLPLVYGNCQAGWAIAMLGADRPDVTGPIVINGAPMSYWAGGEGINPMRLSGGLLGGSWMTRFLCDMGVGLFDGAYLVENFERLNPANTLWKKDYALFAKIDTEQERYLDFERWWTGFYLLDEKEIIWIVRNLFIGNKLEQGVLEIGANHLIDMTKINDPLVIFASSGDNITPPQQALHWISEIYPTTEDLIKAGQRIIYLLNSHIGHLGIFVSAAVARREHHAIIEHIEVMQKLEPGLYQMVIDADTGETDPAKEQSRVHFERRDIKDITFSVPEAEFDKMCQVSEANEKLYLAFGRPIVKALMWHPQQAAILRWFHPARVSRYIWSDRLNPGMKGFEEMAKWVKDNRSKTEEHNTFRYMERRTSDLIATALDAFRDERDTLLEVLFEITYKEPPKF
ncbi:MAG: poly(3-hydroxyalkanoate) synthetase [Deltaproteobacteria bacterium HGW-Deltaproteobacteria-13]|jgi:hypothetical protein|nr:MAG: poly(3-hydroxyalkanoate) synthetase [Deltaproteobacteria bacterium HGW-Deltaproteobacteria-13]